MRLSNAIVVGAGIGGFASAIALAKHGLAVTLIERAETVREVGAGIQISPNGLRVLKALGVARMIERRAVKAKAVSLRRSEDEAEQAYLDLTGGSEPYLFVHRADLIAALREVALHYNVSMEFGVEAKGVTPGDVAVLEMADGRKRRSELIVGADGVRSVLRKDIVGDAKPRFTGQVAWRATVRNIINHPPEARVTMGPRKHLVSYPIRNGESVNIVAVHEQKDWVEEGWSHAGDPAELKQRFSDFTGDALKLVHSVQSVGVWGLHLHPVADRWHAPGVALVGDAAHPMLPFLAQGANMALEDAWVLVDSLARAPEGKELPTYQAARKDRVARVVNIARKNARRYHYRAGPMRWITHSGMRFMSSYAPSRLVGAYDWLYDFDVTKR